MIHFFAERVLFGARRLAMGRQFDVSELYYERHNVLYLACAESLSIIVCAEVNVISMTASRKNRFCGRLEENGDPP